MTAAPTPELSPTVRTTTAYPRQFVSVVTAASVAGVPREVVDRWVRTGQLPAIRIGESQWRVERSVLETFLSGSPAALSVVRSLD